jgi:hypothetical protein
MGRWRADALTASMSDTFWQVLDLHRKVSAPLEHHLRALQTTPPAGEGRGCRKHAKVRTISQECEDIFRDTAWAASIFERFAHHDAADTATLVQELIALVVDLANHTFAAYTRRNLACLEEWGPQLAHHRHSLRASLLHILSLEFINVLRVSLVFLPSLSHWFRLRFPLLLCGLADKPPDQDCNLRSCPSLSFAPLVLFSVLAVARCDSSTREHM